MSVQIQLRRGTSSDWNTQAVAAGEPVLVTGNAKGPLVYIGVTGQNFSGLNAQVASFQPQGGGTTRYGHVVATDQDYTFQMLAAADNARALGMASGGSFTIKSGASFVVDDGATVDFDARPDLNKGARIFVGLDDNNDNVTEQGTIEIKRDAEMVVNVSQQGDVEISPFNAANSTQTNFKVKQSSNDDICAEFQDPNGGRLFRVDNDGISGIPVVTLGGTPAGHADPTFKGLIRSACNPDLVDASANTGAGSNLSERFFTLQHQGDGGQARGQLRLNGGRTTEAGQQAILIMKNDANIGTGFAVNYDGKAQMRDGVVTQTGRTLQDNSLVRKDELLATVLSQFVEVGTTVEVTDSDASFPVGGLRAIAPVRDNDTNNLQFTVTMANCGLETNPNKSLVNAPDGKYMCMCWSNFSNTNREEVRDCETKVIDHVSGSNETFFTLTQVGHTAWGWVMRLS